MKVPRNLALSSSIIVAATTRNYRTSFISLFSKPKMSSVSIIGSTGSSSNANTIDVTPIDITLTCSDGITLAAQKWKPSEPISTAKNIRKILCVHGWMDNCRSYHYFAPNVLQQLRQMNPVAATNANNDDIEIVTIDLPGHGWSSHKSLDGPPIHIADYVYYIAEAIQQLQWSTAKSNRIDEDETCLSIDTEIVLVGHSMGAAICSIYAATFPEQIHKLVLLEGGTLLQ
jgi:pimeloyl-ACP methyl ester carboxylesterase